MSPWFTDTNQAITTKIPSRKNRSMYRCAQRHRHTWETAQDAPKKILWQLVSLISTYNTTSLEYFQYGIGLAPSRIWSKVWNVEMFYDIMYSRMVVWNFWDALFRIKREGKLLKPFVTPNWHGGATVLWAHSIFEYSGFGLSFYLCG